MLNERHESVTVSYIWEFREHVKFVRAVLYLSGKLGTLIIIASLCFGAAVLGILFQAVRQGEWGSAIRTWSPLMVLSVLWVLVTYLWLPVSSARSYRRSNPCVTHTVTRKLSRDGFSSECHTTTMAIRWDGIQKVVETDVFFLLFTAPACAMHLPKRAFAGPEDVARAREICVHALGEKPCFLVQGSA
jgi:hypothetical protein